MNARRIILAVLLIEVLAAVLAVLQSSIGIRTDEAKYLLNIPYPHPPLARTILSMTEGWMYQELFWRFLFASLMLQGAWMVVALHKKTVQEATLRSSRSGAGGLFSHVGQLTEQKTARSASVWFSSSMLILAWLTTAAVLLQAGTIMMAPLTAVQILLFLWLLSCGEHNTPWAYWISLLWLVALFTAYQAALFFPLVLAIFLRMRLPLLYRFLLFVVPLALLALYTLINPLVLASMLIYGEAGSWAERFLATGWLWIIGGSGVVSILGVMGLLFQRSWAALMTLALVAVYVLLSPHEYYAILFTPILFFGAVSLLRRWPRLSYVLLGVPFLSALLLIRQPWNPPPIDPAATIRMLNLDPVYGDLLLRGTFGHEWQYASTVPIRRYHTRHLADAQAVLCLEACEEMQRQQKWERLEGAPVETWVRRK